MSPAAPSLVCLGLLFAAPAAHAADCGAVAAQVASQTGGEVLDWREDGRGGCVIKVAVPQNGRPPVIRTVRVPG